MAELNKRFSSKDNSEKKLEVLKKIFGLYSELAEEVQEDDIDKAIYYRMKAAKTSSKIVTLEEDDDKKEEMIDEALNLFMLLEIIIN